MVEEDILISVCAGLVVVDLESRTLRLVHYTAQAYLSSHRIELLPVKEQDIVASCMTSLMFVPHTRTELDTFHEGRLPVTFTRKCKWGTSSRYFNHAPLGGSRLPYAGEHWLSHVRGKMENDPFIRSLVIELLNEDLAVEICFRYQDLSSPRNSHKFLYNRLIQRRTRFAPLHVASCFNLPSIIEFLLDSVTPIEQGDDPDNELRGFTALMWAAERGCDSVIELLLRRGASVRKVHRYDESALDIYVRNGHHRLVSLFCKCDAALDDEDHTLWRTAVEIALEYSNKLAIVQLFKDGAGVQQKLKLLSPPLKRATRDTKMALVLIESGADPRTEFNVFAPLHLAVLAIHFRHEIVQAMLEHGANVNLRNTQRWTELDREVPKIFRDNIRSARSEARDDGDTRVTGWTPLHFATILERKKVVRLLLKNGADPNLGDRRGRTPLHFANEGGDSSMPLLLVEWGARLDDVSHVQDDESSREGRDSSL